MFFRLDVRVGVSDLNQLMLPNAVDRGVYQALYPRHCERHQTNSTTGAE